jgi:hypothetical protein
MAALCSTVLITHKSQSENTIIGVDLETDEILFQCRATETYNIDQVYDHHNNRLYTTTIFPEYALNCYAIPTTASFHSNDSVIPFDDSANCINVAIVE